VNKTTNLLTKPQVEVDNSAARPASGTRFADEFVGVGCIPVDVIHNGVAAPSLGDNCSSVHHENNNNPQLFGRSLTLP